MIQRKVWSTFRFRKAEWLDEIEKGDSSLSSYGGGEHW